jgi:ferredoxin, 2Fe-2S
MAKILYVENGGAEHQLEVDPGMSVMEGAVRNDVAGIDADCGGACACATCHVYVDDAWLDKIEPPSEMELAMLELASNVRSNSRLSCQIKVSEKSEGMTVRIPESQH